MMTKGMQRLGSSGFPEHQGYGVTPPAQGRRRTVEVNAEKLQDQFSVQQWSPERAKKDGLDLSQWTESPGARAQSQPSTLPVSSVPRQPLVISSSAPIFSAIPMSGVDHQKPAPLTTPALVRQPLQPIYDATISQYVPSLTPQISAVAHSPALLAIPDLQSEEDLQFTGDQTVGVA
mmetsp:Transcript_32838/g.51193  ORF Transcript_32838/g.51193 Transcript_32838/m.51193 type:complete len:176 (-) Transcript_32838:1428-1955(-)